MFFEEKKNYTAPAIIVEKLETERIMNHYGNTGTGGTKYEEEKGDNGWVPGWY
ncbi:MAG: hypothetical protein U0K54_01385 [Acutalibacteraceae bacterium]|nr:hypothetical protein [Acutalibacteraceae bacterium]